VTRIIGETRPDFNPQRIFLCNHSPSRVFWPISVDPSQHSVATFADQLKESAERIAPKCARDRRFPRACL